MKKDIDCSLYHSVIPAGNSGKGKIDEAVVKGRKNEAWRTQYMKELVIIQDAIEEERERAEKAEERAGKAEERAEKAEERAEKAEARIRELEAMIKAG